MDSFELAKILLGKKSNEGTNEKAKSTVMATGTATSDSSNGKVMVDMGGDTISYDDVQSVEMDTNVSVKTGDIVQILLTGASGTSKYPVVIGVIGRGDEQDAEIQEAKTTAEQANSNSEEAKRKAEEAETKAQTASENADSAKQSANAASETANSANTNANAAKELAASANTVSAQANEKAEQAQTDAASALKKANTAQSGVDAANKDITTLQGNIDAMNTDIADAQKKVQANGDAITGINQKLTTTYATKTEVSETKAAIESDISTSASNLAASVKETYASKSDVSTIQGELENKIQVNADGISSTSKKVESLESDTQDISTKLNAAAKTASDAQAQADTAVANAQTAQATADKAVSDAKAADDKAKTAQSQLDTAKQNVAAADAALKTAKQNYDSALATYNSVKSSSTATEAQIKAAKDSLDSAQTALNKALADVLTANHNVTEAQTAANDALKNATTAYSNAATALVNAKTAQDTADKAVADAAKANKDLAALTSRVTTTETAIKQTNESITSLAKRTDTVENKFTGYYTKTETDSQISQKADSITSTVSQTYETKTDSASKLSSAKSYADNVANAAKAAASKLAQQAQSTANSKITTFYQDDAPTSGMSKGDLWIDANDGNSLHRYDGTAWTSVKDSGITKALNDAKTAQSTADGKIVTFAQTTQPTATDVGDIWIDTDDNNKLYRWSGSAWVAYRDGMIAESLGQAKTYADSQIKQSADSITSTVSQTYETKTDSASKLSSAKSYADSSSSQALKDAKADTDNKLKNYSTTTQMNSAISQKADSITAIVSKKVGKDEVISSINQSAEGVTINANKVNINGTVSANGNFKVDTAGNLTAKSATLENCTISGTLNVGTKFSDGSTVKDAITNAQNTANNAIKSTVVEFAQNQSSTTAPTSGWSTTAPTWKNGYYMWQRTTTVKNNGQSSSVTTCITGATGATGATGPQGPNGENGVDLSNGKMLFTDPYFSNSLNNCAIYNNIDNGNGNVKIERVTISSDNPFSATYVTSYELKIVNTGTAYPYCGGFHWSNWTRANAIFIYRIIAKIPTGRHLLFASNARGDNPSEKWLTSNNGTGKFTEYIFKLICGATGTFQDTGYFFIDGSAGTADNPIEWRVAYATCFDMTSGSDVATALSTANGKNKAIYSTSDPSSTSGYTSGDTWFNKSTGGIWQFNGSAWAVHQVGTVSIQDGAVTADKIVSHAVTSEKISVVDLSAISANLGEVTAGAIMTPDNGQTFTLDATNKKLTWNLPNTTMNEDGTIYSGGTNAKGKKITSTFGSGQIYNASMYDGSNQCAIITESNIILNYQLTANSANTNYFTQLSPSGINIYQQPISGGTSTPIFEVGNPKYNYGFKYKGCRVPVVTDGTVTASGGTSCYLTSLSALSNAGLDTNHIIVVAMLIHPSGATHIQGVQYMSSNSSYYALFSGGITSGTSVRWMAISYF